MRACIYARVSSADQQARDTIASQLSTLPAYCATQGWTVVRTEIDDGKSAAAGKLERRDGLHRLLAAARAGAIDVVVVVNLNRLTRAEDIAERGMIYGALQAAGVKIAVSSTGMLLDLRSQLGDLMAAIGGVFAADENRTRIEAIMRGKARAASEGRKPAGPTPWGYTYDRESGTWGIHPFFGPLLLEIHKRVAAGETCGAVADDLNQRCVPRCPPSKRGARKPGRWSVECVYKIVTCTTYHSGRHVVDKARNQAVAVPTIISEAMFLATQRRLARHKKRGNPRGQHPRLIAGLAVCAVCRAAGRTSEIVSAQVTIRGGNVLYYVCSQRKRPRHGVPRCSLPMLRHDRVDDAVWRWVCGKLAGEGDLTRIAAEQTNAVDLSLLERDLGAARKRLKRLGEVEATVLHQQREGLLSAEGVRAELRRLAQERRFAQGEIEGLEAQRTRYSARETAAEDLRGALEQLRARIDGASFAERRQVLELLVPGERYMLEIGPTEIRAPLRVPEAAETAELAARLHASS